MSTRIVRWDTGAVIWEGEAETVKEALHAAVRASVNCWRANLRDANLGGADLTGANLTLFRDDLWAVFSAAPAEVPAVLAALKEGRVNGSAYSGECACLVGTIANARHCDYESIPGLRPDARRPAEQWFLGIPVAS